MKITHIEPYLITSRPDMQSVNREFIERTMTMLRALHQPAKRPFIAWLRHLPKAAVVALAVAALTLVSGATYAVYTLWIKPIVTTSEVRENQYGRTEVVTNLTGCLQLKEKAIFEIKQGSALPATEVAAVVQAKCEMDAIRKWVNDTYYKPGMVENREYVDAWGSNEFESLEGNTLKVKDIETGDILTYTLTDNARFIDRGYESDRNAFKKGDTVSRITYMHYPPEMGSPSKIEVRGLIKLSLPSIYYGSQKQNSITERAPCFGNPEDTCLTNGASIDLYPHNEGSTDHPNPAGDIPRTIQGKIASHNGATFTVEGTSGAIYTITAPRDIITEFNTQYSKNYDGLQVKVGDTVTVVYRQTEGANAKQVAAGDILFINLTIDLIKKQDPIKKY